MGAALSEDAAQIEGQETVVKDMMGIIFDQIFIYRYRDVVEDIRLSCITSIGRALAKLPSFITDSHLKYLGWTLNDVQSPTVRLGSLTSLHAIYKACAKDTTCMQHFTERFETRFYEMMKDTDPFVAAEAIRLVTRLQELRLLTTFDSTKQVALRLMCSKYGRHPKVCCRHSTRAWLHYRVPQPRIHRHLLASFFAIDICRAGHIAAAPSPTRSR